MTQIERAPVVDLAGVGASTLAELWQTADASLRPALGYEVGVFATLDPATLLWTSCDTMGADHDPERESVLFDCEYGGDDLLQIADLVLADRPTGSLHAATGGDLHRSRRYRLVLHEFGVTDELRLVLRSDGRCWGSMSAFRLRGVFDDDALDLAAAWSEPLARAVRDVLLAGLDGPPDAATGTLVIDGTGDVVATTEAAEQILALVEPDRVPAAVRSVVMAARRGRQASASLPTVEGSWISLHALPVKGAATRGVGEDDIAVVVEPTRPPALARVIVDAYGLTEREREVLSELLRAEPVKRIAQHLELSEHTVRDHLKRIYRKVGGQTRHEVALRIFHEQYLPRRQQGCAPSPFGFFAGE